MTTELIQRDTVAQMVENYQQAVEDVKQAYTLLCGAKHRLKSSFGGNYSSSFDPLPSGRYSYIDEKTVATVIAQLKLEAWRCLVQRLELRKILSIQRTAELDKQMEKPDNLPEITLENVWAMLDQTMANTATYMQEQVFEAFDFLRPPRSEYKTNTEFELGKRVILTWQVAEGYGGHPFKVNYHRAKQLTALDTAFRLLDGKGPYESYNGPLTDAINTSKDGKGQTDYFNFICYKNGNLHLEFRRSDLVTMMNKMCGGERLKAA